MKKIKLLTSVLAISCFSIANAATTSKTVEITTLVQPVCSVVAQNMAFSVIQLTPGVSNSVTTSSNVLVECTKDTAYTIKMDGGLNLATDGTTRRLKHTTAVEYLNYGLSLNGSNIIVNQPFTSGVGTGFGSASSPIELLGSINTNQTATAGNYNDIVTLFVEY